MRAAKIAGKREFVIKDVPDPVLERDEVMVKVQYCGICGSDLHIFKEGAELGAGHEFAGDIVAVGEDVKGWSVGDRVAVNPHLGCGECFWCARGETGLCEQFNVRLIESPGSFSTFVKVKHIQLHKLPEGMDYGQAVIVEPATCALHAVNIAGMEKGDVVAVLGLGAIGQLAARIAKALGASAVYAVDISPTRIELARSEVDEVIDAKTTNPVDRILELTNGRGPDVVIECAGNVTTTQQAVAMVRNGGTIAIAGICFDWVELPVSNIVLRGITIRGSMCFSEGEYDEAFELIKEGKIEVDSLLECRMSLDEINEAFEMASRGEGGKILIKP